MSEQAMCVIRVPTRGMNFFHDHRCPHRAKVFVDGKGYCGIHDPERVAAKRKESDEKWAREWAAQQRSWARDAKAREIVAAALDWRRLHFTDPPCPECEHLDCALARKVDEHEHA